jgi:hypothetical protein
MGNAKEALSTIINKLENIEEVLICFSIILPVYKKSYSILDKLYIRLDGNINLELHYTGC